MNIFGHNLYEDSNGNFQLRPATPPMKDITDKVRVVSSRKRNQPNVLQRIWQRLREQDLSEWAPKIIVAMVIFIMAAFVVPNYFVAAWRSHYCLPADFDQSDPQNRYLISLCFQTGRPVNQ